MSSLPTSSLLTSRRRRMGSPYWIGPLMSFALGMASAGLSRLAAGPGLGLYLGTFLLATLAFPQMAIIPLAGARMSRGTGVSPVFPGEEHGRDARATVVLSVIPTWIGIAVPWGFTLNSADVSVLNIVLCLLVLAAYFIAIAGVVSALYRLGFPPILAGAVVGTVAICWLTWPVWLSGLLSGPHGETIAGWLVPFDPLIAVNAVLKQFGAWDHAYSIAYNHLTTLNQDTPYRMPRTIFPSVLFHGVIAVAGFIVAARPSSSAPAR